MKRSTFILIAAIISILFGLGFLLVPATVMSLYGSKLDTLGTFIARYFGAALFGVGVIFFASRNATTFEEIAKAGLLGGLVLGVTGLVVAIWDGFAGVSNNFVWVNTAIYTFITLGFGYFYFKK
jgi:hypothetical protein